MLLTRNISNRSNNLLVKEVFEFKLFSVGYYVCYNCHGFLLRAMTKEKDGPTFSFLITEPNSVTLKMEAVCSSKTSVSTYDPTQLQNSGDQHLRNTFCESLNTYNYYYPL
jgi:hypothetical protein